MNRLLARHALHAVMLLGFGAAASCQPLATLYVDSPVAHSFITVDGSNTLTVEGRLLHPLLFSEVRVNGAYVHPGAAWTIDIPVDPADVFQRINVVGTTLSGKVLSETLVVVMTDGVNSVAVPDGDAAQGAGIRFSDTGLAQVEPLIESMAGGAIDISGLILGQNPIAEGNEAGIDYSANAVDASIGGFSLTADSVPGAINTDITIEDFFIEIDLDLDWLGSCTLEVSTSDTLIQGAYSVEPDATDPTIPDVNAAGPVTVTLGGFSSRFVSGVCDDFLIGDIVDLILSEGAIQDLMQSGFESSLADPDGAGPLDSPLAAAIQDALAGISIAGPVGDALDSQVDGPIIAIAEDDDGVTVEAEVSITALNPLPEAPDFAYSYGVNETFPTFGPTSPDLGLPYGIALAISNTGMNQLLKSQVENGLLRSSISEMFGSPITVGLMTLFVPAFGDVEPTEPMRIDIAPTLAPVFSGNPGPQGEFAELKLAGLEIDMVLLNYDASILTVEVDLDAGVDLTFDAAGLNFGLATPETEDVTVAVTHNPLGADEADVIFTFQSLFPLFAPELENAIEAFPIPSFLGMDLVPVELTRLPGGYIGLFADLVARPTTHIENVVFTDNSTGDFRESGGCWLREWRHRIAGTSSATTVNANLKGMLGTDAGCTTNDASSLATGAYTVDFDVVAVEGETWTLDLAHSINGAFDRISDGYNDGIGFLDGGGATWFNTNVRGSYSLNGGAAVPFDFAANPSGLPWDDHGGPSTNEDLPFSGASSVRVSGTESTSVRLSFSFEMEGDSDSNAAFPTTNGDELAIRLGKNDTIDNNFTAGAYPGMGDRNIAEDGHFMSVVLTTEPTP